MIETFKDLLKQPYWVIALVLGAVLIGASCVTIGAGRFEGHPPRSMVLVLAGAGLVLISFASMVLGRPPRIERSATAAGLDLTRVREHNDVMAVDIGNCEVRIVNGRLEQIGGVGRGVVVLPCNEYFDDRCIDDTTSALGAYVNGAFKGRASAFAALLLRECSKQLGAGEEQQKTREERATSYGGGRCLLLTRPLGDPVPVALVSTTTQRAGEGLAARTSFMFDGMRELVARMADARFDEVIMPVLGAGHGRISAPLALVGLLLAVAEAVLYGQGGQRLRQVTIVVFRRDVRSAPEVDPVVVRRALALIASPRGELLAKSA